MIVYIGTEEMNEGYDATVTLKIELFATEALAQAWCKELKSDDPNYMWRNYEPATIREVQP